MSTKEELLLKLSESRADYKAFVEQVDEDLRVERIKRLAIRQGTIAHEVIEAWGAGASIAELKRAYNTKDYKTIRKIIDSLEAPEQAVVAARVESEPERWFIIDWVDNILEVGQDEYQIIVLDDGADFMLLIQEGADQLDLDGTMESGSHGEGKQAEIFKAIREGLPA